MGKDSLSSKEDPKPQLDNVLKLLLATISLDNYEDAFIQHGILTLQDLQNHNPDSLISMGILNRGQYDDLMGICSTIAPISASGKPFNPEQYQQSILSSLYGQRLRMSIVQSKQSRMGEEFYQESDDSFDLLNTNDSSLSHDILNQSNSRFSFLSNASEESLPFLEFDEMERQMGIVSRPQSQTQAIQSRHTVDVSRVQRLQAPLPFLPSVNTPSSPSTLIHPRATVAVPTVGEITEPEAPVSHLEAIQESTGCDGLREMSGGVYDDPTGRGSLQVTIASLSQPSSVVVTSSSVAIPILAKDQRSRTMTSFIFSSIFVQNTCDALVFDIVNQLIPSIHPLFSGQCFTVLFYGSLASPASSLLLSPTSELCVPARFGSQLLQQCKDRKWSLGMSCFMFNDNIATDLLNNNDRRTVMDSGSIIFMKGMKCYATDTENDILAVLHTAQETIPSPPPASSSVVVLFQLITPQGQYGARAAFILLPPCDRVIPVTQGSTHGYHNNNNSIAALSNMSRIFENRVRQPFRDNKLTLYLRPFLLSTTTVLIGCLPPYDDSQPSVPSIYRVKSPPGPRRLSRFVASKPRTLSLSPTKNTDNFVSILRYCARLHGQKESKPTHPGLHYSQHLNPSLPQPHQQSPPRLRVNSRVDVAALNRDGAELLKQLNLVDTLAKSYVRSYPMSMRSKCSHARELSSKAKSIMNSLTNY